MMCMCLLQRKLPINFQWTSFSSFRERFSTISFQKEKIMHFRRICHSMSFENKSDEKNLCHVFMRLISFDWKDFKRWFWGWKVCECVKSKSSWCLVAWRLWIDPSRSSRLVMLIVRHTMNSTPNKLWMNSSVRRSRFVPSMWQWMWKLNTY